MTDYRLAFVVAVAFCAVALFVLGLAAIRVGELKDELARCKAALKELAKCHF